MQDMRSDAEIVQAVLGGDVNAFETLVLRYQKKVYNTVLRLTGDSVQAEDLSQEVFLKIFRGLSSFRGESSFSTYIYRVAANTAIDALRRREAPTVSLSAENEEGEEFELALPDPGPLPVELLESRERRQATSSRRYCSVPASSVYSAGMQKTPAYPLSRSTATARAQSVAPCPPVVK